MTTSRSDGFSHIIVIVVAVLILGALSLLGFRALMLQSNKQPATITSVQKLVDSGTQNESDVEAAQQKAYSSTSSDITSAASSLENSYAN